MKKLYSPIFLIAMSLALGAADKDPADGLISPKEAKALLDKDKTAILLDVRTEEEFDAGHIRGATLLPYDEITAETAKKAVRAAETLVIVYCRSGRRSAIAAKALRDLGYRRVLDLGGIASWPYEIVVERNGKE